MSVLQRQAGMTLIEVLVALLVVSVGMLGIAALQMTSLRGNQESYGRTQASIMAADILERMRANQAGVFRGEYNVARDGATSAGALAQLDLVAWQGTINALLGAGAGGAIDVDADGVATVTITWQERSRKELSNQAEQVGGDISFVTRSEI